MNDARMNESEEERRRRRRRRLEEMKRQKRRAELIQRRVVPMAAIAVLLVAALSAGILAAGNRGTRQDNREGQYAALQGGKPEQGESYVMLTMPPETEGEEEPEEEGEGAPPLQEPSGEFWENKQPENYVAVSTAATTGIADSVISTYGVIIDVENGVILAQREAKSRMVPASMTKVLTVLTAADALGISGDNWADNPVLDDTFEMTIEITDYCYVNEGSAVGFSIGEKVAVRDLFYGTILTSGADAAVGLACYVAGSHEAFVEMMNQKLEELGLSESSHFTNCVGFYDSEHYSTVYDIAVMLKVASDNPFCRAVLSAHRYTTGATAQHPDGIPISNRFLCRMEDKDTHGEVICGKTGYVTESKNCAASLAADVKGKEYICVTAGSSGIWPCIEDQVQIYQAWLEQ